MSEPAKYIIERLGICSTDGCDLPLTKGPGFDEGICHTCNKAKYVAENVRKAAEKLIDDE